MVDDQWRGTHSIDTIVSDRLSTNIIQTLVDVVGDEVGISDGETRG